MSRPKQEAKRKFCIEHRAYVYQKTIGRVLSGELPPDYMRERWDKLKEIRGK